MAEDSKSTADWRKLYTDLVKSLALETESHDKRKHARLLVPDEIDLVIEIGAESHEVIDISPGGISFFTDRPNSGGEEVTISYDNTFKLNSDVVYCSVEGADVPEYEEGHRVGARFLEEDEGYRIMVMMLEFYEGKLSGSIG